MSHVPTSKGPEIQCWILDIASRYENSGLPPRRSTRTVCPGRNQYDQVAPLLEVSTMSQASPGQKYIHHTFKSIQVKSKNQALIFLILNYISSPLQSKAMFKSEFYISNLASAFMSTDTFSSTDPITKNTKEENYKGHSMIN